MKNIIRVLAGLLAGGFLVFLADCQGQEDVTAKVDELVNREMRRQHIPGVSLAVITNGQIILAKGYGLANVEHQVPVKPETIFQSGSVGKQFTATAVMMLVEAGKIHLDDNINKYLTKAPGSWGKIKVRHLLTHTSGMGDYPSDFDFRRDYTEDQLLARLSKIPLEFQPGQKWSYSNVGYLASAKGPVEKNLRKAMIYGSIVASYCCEGFGVTATTRATRAGIEKRRKTLEEATRF